MSLNVKRQELLARALVAVARAAHDGGLIATDEVAAALLEKNPDCSMSLDEVRDEIARLAVANCVCVEFGTRPKYVSRQRNLH